MNASFDERVAAQEPADKTNDSESAQAPANPPGSAQRHDAGEEHASRKDAGGDDAGTQEDTASGGAPEPPSR